MRRNRSWTLLPVALAMCFVPKKSAAETPQEIEALKADLRVLQNEVNALRMALSEAAELDRQRAALISRALEGGRGDGLAPSLPSPEPVAKKSEGRAERGKGDPAKATQVSVLDKRRG